MSPDPSPPPRVEVVDDGPVAVDTGDAGPAEVAAVVARARIDGASRVRTAHPRSAVRAAAVIDAIRAAAGTAGSTIDGSA